MTEQRPSPLHVLPEEFLSRLVTELDDETVTAIILHGSYARGDALPPYSDVDLVRIMKDTSHHNEQKRFLSREGYLLSVSSRPLSIYRERFTLPEKAIFLVPGVREARILLDKEDAFHTLQQEAWAWTWEPLQTAANTYAVQFLMEQTEIVLKLLRALMLGDLLALADMILDLFSAVTEILAVQRGVLVHSGNTYFHQVVETVGHDSLWVQYLLRAAGIVPQAPSPPSIQERGIASIGANFNKRIGKTSRFKQPENEASHRPEKTNESADEGCPAQSVVSEGDILASGQRG